MEKFLRYKNISVSILDIEDVDKYLSEIKLIQEKYNLDNIVIHFDVMDGIFVNNIGVDIQDILLAKKYGFFVDVHLMVDDPISYIDECVNLGADNITVHYEIKNLYKVINYLNKFNISKGLAVKPKTSVLNALNYANDFDMILLMSVEPGYGSQKYITTINEKISSAVFTKKMVQVDGGINCETIISPNKLGV
ncbi:MAG: hypothetical protein RSF67_06030, partial [Clostridia bacterium]